MNAFQRASVLTDAAPSMRSRTATPAAAGNFSPSPSRLSRSSSSRNWRSSVRKAPSSSGTKRPSARSMRSMSSRSSRTRPSSASTVPLIANHPSPLFTLALKRLKLASPLRAIFRPSGHSIAGGVASARSSSKNSRLSARSSSVHSGPSPPRSRLGHASTRAAARRRSAERSRRARMCPALTTRPPWPGRKCGPDGPPGRTTRTTLRPSPCGDRRTTGFGSPSVASASSISPVSIRIGSAGVGRRASEASRARADFGMAMPAPDRIAAVSTALASTTTTRQRPGVSISMKTPGASASWDRARRKPEASDDSTSSGRASTSSTAVLGERASNTRGWPTRAGKTSSARHSNCS